MPQFNRLPLKIALLLCLSAPLFGQANDITISSAIMAPSAVSDLSFSGDSNNPEFAAAQVLSMEEVDVWARIRKGFNIQDLDNPLVASQAAHYSANPDYFLRTTSRASRYLFHVVQELDKRGMPTELALLPFVESAFNPEAYSSAKASGLWQFIPSTGLLYKLKQTMFKDERRDVLASTDAALNYLEKLYGMFGDWQLALAAYNWGEGSVQRAIKKNEAAGKPTDFNSLSELMPAETRNYVPKLLAIKNIIADPGQYGIKLPKVENQPYFVTINKTRNIDVKIAAQLAELPINEFKALNPQFNRPVIIGGDKTQILLPHENAEKFQRNLAKWQRPLSTWTSITVSTRQRIENIAHMFSTKAEVIREVNHIPQKMVLKAGSTILVPKVSDATYSDITADVADNATMAVEPDHPDTRRIVVKVGKRDSLASIATRYQVTIAQLKDWNSLSHDKLTFGQHLRLQVPFASRAGRSSARAGNHRVKAVISKKRNR
ncbi:transglycosylase SLT domain-containing protein [Herminiimonas sp. CN]|uniref:transglycosylase SLT domain-containing protein n=1 Tax=Herminiimonas sp. CN TaxID=1349818 RepID=UPI00068547FF